MIEAGERFEVYVRAAMKDRGLSLNALARDSGVSVSAWHGWFNGKRRPRRNSLVLVAPSLGRTADQLAAAWTGKRSPARRSATETADPVAQAISALADRLERLEVAQVEGFDAVLKAIAAASGGPARTKTSRGSGRAAPSGTAR